MTKEIHHDLQWLLALAVVNLILLLIYTPIAYHYFAQDRWLSSEPQDLLMTIAIVMSIVLLIYNVYLLGKYADSLISSLQQK